MREQHSTKVVVNNSGEERNIDTGIADLIKILWKSNIRTVYSCEGSPICDDYPDPFTYEPYISFASLSEAFFFKEVIEHFIDWFCRKNYITLSIRNPFCDIDIGYLANAQSPSPPLVRFPKYILILVNNHLEIFEKFLLKALPVSETDWNRVIDKWPMA